MGGSERPAQKFSAESTGRAVLVCFQFFLTESQKFIYIIRWTFPHNSNSHPFSRKFGRSAEDSVIRLTISRESY